MRLHLGVMDIPYVMAPTPGQKKMPAQVMTGDVANWLEHKYHIMEIFYHFNADKIAEWLHADTEAHLVNSVLQGASSGGASNAVEDPVMYRETMMKITAAFKMWLSDRSMEALGYPGVPTRAARQGRSNRFKNKKNPQGSRPSFIDTGLYQSSAIAWVEK